MVEDTIEAVDRSDNAAQQGLAPSTRGEAAAAGARRSMVEETIEAACSEATKIDDPLACALESGQKHPLYKVARANLRIPLSKMWS